MEYRQLGKSGLHVPVLSLGTGTFGGSNDFFKRWGSTDVQGAKKLIDMCFAHGVNLFDTADIYSEGAAETILGQALGSRRHEALISTKASFAMGEGPNNRGSSRHHLLKSCEASLKRLNTDYIDLYFMHGFDALTPVEETLMTLDHFIQSGKVRYIGCSNYSGWHLMKALAVSKAQNLARYVVYQGYYSLVGREYEWELMPLGLDQGVGLMVWSPLGWGRLTGKIRRNQPTQAGRIQSGGAAGGPLVAENYLHNVVDVLAEIADETGKTIPQIALNWTLTRPTVCNLIIGARDEVQLEQNLGAVGWQLSPDHLHRLALVSHQHPTYPYWHQMGYDNMLPKPVAW
jgi:aryl-alcohol dehydrogenase-like predicted oxidoreductase